MEQKGGNGVQENLLRQKTVLYKLDKNDFLINEFWILLNLGRREDSIKGDSKFALDFMYKS